MIMAMIKKRKREQVKAKQTKHKHASVLFFEYVIGDRPNFRQRNTPLLSSAQSWSTANLYEPPSPLRKMRTSFVLAVSFFSSSNVYVVEGVVVIVVRMDHFS